MSGYKMQLDEQPEDKDEDDLSEFNLTDEECSECGETLEDGEDGICVYCFEDLEHPDDFEDEDLDDEDMEEHD